MSFIFVLLVWGIGFATGCYCLTASDKDIFTADTVIQLESEIESLKKECWMHCVRYSHLLAKNRQLENELYKESLRKPNPMTIPKGTIEAVKYAMIHNHPDNGGDAEKFILFKNCYDKLINGKKG